MNPENSGALNRGLAAIGVGICSTGRTADAWSRLLSGVTLLAYALPAPASDIWLATLAIALATGFGQGYFALRLAFDKPILKEWLARPSTPSDFGPELAGFDAALAQSGLDVTTRKPRGLAERVRGVIRLHRIQLILLALQITAVTGAAAIYFLANRLST